MTLLERPKVWQVPETPTGRRFEWTMWVVLAFLIVAGVTAGILLSVDDVGVSEDEIVATLAFDNSVAADRIAAMNEATGNDLALKLTSLRAIEERYPGRLEMLATSAHRSDQALGYTIERLAGS